MHSKLGNRGIQPVVERTFETSRLRDQLVAKSYELLAPVLKRVAMRGSPLRTEFPALTEGKESSRCQATR